MEVLRPKKWDEFQHYKKRTPPWVKLHRGTLDNYDYHCLPIASKAIAPLMWLIASEYDFGEIPLDYDMISFRLRMSVADTKKAIKPLIDKGFFLLDSTTLADCKQDSPLEGETEGEGETEKIAFECFYSDYPKKKKKPDAERAWNKLNNIDRQLAIGVLPLHKKHWKDPQYIPYPATWLNSKQWQDELEPISTPKSSGTDGWSDEQREAVKRIREEAGV